MLFQQVQGVVAVVSGLSGTVNCPTPRRQGWRRAGSFMKWPSAPGTATSCRSWQPAPTETTADGSAILRHKPTFGRSSTATCCSGSGTTRARASAACFIDDYLDRHSACGEVKVRPGAWNTGWHDGSGFTQWISSSTPQRTLTRLDEISQAMYLPARASPLAGLAGRDRDQLQLFLATPDCSAARTISTSHRLPG